LRRASFAVIAILLLPLTVYAAELVSLRAAAEPLSVDVVESSVARTVIEFEVNAFTRTAADIDGELYYAIGIPGEAKMLSEGLPDLPLAARSIVIPDDAEMAVAVVASHYTDFPDVPVAPSKGLLMRNVDPATVPYSFSSSYESGGWYPEDLAYLREPYILRDVRGVTVVVSPVQYDPSTRTLRVYDRIVVEVAAVGPGKVNVLERRPSGRMNAEFRKIYERHFLNFGSADYLRYAPVDEVGNMLVICYGSFMSNMEPFVEWKKQMGIPCEMVSVTTAGSTSAAIGSYIDDYYYEHGLTYVLLVGDAAQVPTPYASGGSSDPTYSLVAGSDNYPDLFVGRFSAETAGQVDTQVERSIEYEEFPLAGGDWYHKGTGIASNQGPGDDGEYDNQHEDNIRADLLAFTYTEIDRIYDPTANPTMVSNALNDGRSIVNYTGHGSTTSWGSSDFSSSHVNALVNDNMLPFIISVACVNGYFDGITCFAEAWLRATNGSEPTGAVGTYMSSINQSWDPPMAAQDEVVDLLVGTSAYGVKRTFGGLCYNGSCLMMDEYGSGGASMFLTWHVFGDPSLRVRTDTPAALTVVHDENVSPTASAFDVTVVGVEGALCALYYDGTLYGSAFADAGGSASIPIREAPPTDVDLTLTVTSFNAMPYFGSVTVAEAYVPEIAVMPDSYDVVLDPEEALVETLLIGNIGEPLSVLHFEIEILDGGGVRSLGRAPVAGPEQSRRSNVESAAGRVFHVYGPVSWLTVVPMSGDVPAGGTQEVVLTFDASGLSDGDYHADLNIDSNGGDRVVVPAVLHVQATGVDVDVPSASILYGNHPNPFTPGTSIAFGLPDARHVRVTIFDVRGRLVRTLADGVFEAGPHDVPWDGTNSAGEPLGSGVYFYRLEAGDRTHEGRMVLLK
jgi:hypothetical protein